jgi:hypothetical protein
MSTEYHSHVRYGAQVVLRLSSGVLKLVEIQKNAYVYCPERIQMYLDSFNSCHKLSSECELGPLFLEN